MKLSNKISKYLRLTHRHISYFFAGVILLYAISGIVLNHRDSINPNFTVERLEYKLPNDVLVSKNVVNKASVIDYLKTIDEDKNYTKHYFPTENTMKVFLKSGSNVSVDFDSRTVVYEKLTRRPFLSSITSLHYNPGRWWTYFSDAFAVCLIIITVTGLFLVKGKKGFIGIGGIEFLLGVAIPILFLLL